MLNELEDGLLERFVRGEQDAFESLFRQFEAEVCRWILRIVRDHSGAEDVLVEAFWRAYRGRAGFDSSRSFGAWMRKIATNAALDHLKKERRGFELRAHEVSVPAPAGSDSDLSGAIAYAFRLLSPKLRLVATLALIEDRPYAEIAEALDLPLGTVKSRVFRAARNLRKELGRLGIRP
jgi:RNA polymerase sigma-70 factor (ECF subfamily)